VASAVRRLEKEVRVVVMHVSPVRDRLVKVTLTGRLDSAGVNQVEARFVESVVSRNNSAIVDLSQVDFVTSLGLRMFVSAARTLRTQQATLALYGARDGVKQVFDLVSLEKIVPICSTEAEALAAVDAPIG
jgi:anti-anti-sigma factor